MPAATVSRSTISWPLIAFTWGYCIFWMFIEDLAKRAVYRHLSHGGPNRQKFLRRMQEHLLPGA